MKKSLVILAAGMGSRYGGLKQVDPVGPNGETIMDYSVYDAIRAGFTKVVFVIRHDFEELFREKIGSKYASKIEVAYAFQEMDDLPAGFALPPERQKPWGTAHALRAARNVVQEPFAAINADDFYGEDAFRRLGAFLDRPAGEMDFAMVGFRLDQTLSENGSVARGICQVDDQGSLLSVVEMTKIFRTSSGAENREIPDQPVPLSGKELVSMNFWGFKPALFQALEEKFPLWLKENLSKPKAEWYVPFVVDELIHAGKAHVSLLPTDASWFGVTYREDAPYVKASIRALVDAGAYPTAGLFL